MISGPVDGEQPTNFPFTPKGVAMREEVARFKTRMKELGFNENWIKIHFK